MVSFCPGWLIGIKEPQKLGGITAGTKRCWKLLMDSVDEHEETESSSDKEVSETAELEYCGSMSSAAGGDGG